MEFVKITFKSWRFILIGCLCVQTSRLILYIEMVKGRGELSYLAPLGSENISAPYFKQCFFQGGGYYSPD